MARLPVPLTPRPDPPGEGYRHKIMMSVGDQRFELTVRVESREVISGPAEVIELPLRNTSDGEAPL